MKGWAYVTAHFAPLEIADIVILLAKDKKELVWKKNYANRSLILEKKLHGGAKQWQRLIFPCFPSSSPFQHNPPFYWDHKSPKSENLLLCRCFVDDS